MKTRIILFVLIVIGSLKTFSKTRDKLLNSKESRTASNKLVINSSDSIIFDLASATLTATYLDLPICIKSNDVIFSFDFAMRFNMAKLTYSVMIDLLPSNPTFVSSAFFNPGDLFLRNTSSSQQSIPANGVHVTKIRFVISAPCTPISASDFSDLLGILNGTQCSARVTNLNFSKFIPAADFNNTSTCLNSYVQFSDASTVGNGSIACWWWSFGNGSSSMLQNNITSYSLAGTVTASLIVASTSGCKDTIIKSLIISTPPVSSFTYSFNCIKDTVYFTNTSTVSSGTITNSLWYFGDLSSISNVKHPSHHYNVNTSYKVKLTSISGSSCAASVVQEVSLRPADINKDGKVDVNDVLLLVPAMGFSCY